MSRSYKRPYIAKYVNKSWKDKHFLHKKERHIVRELLNSSNDYDYTQPLLPTHVNEVTDLWDFNGYQTEITKKCDWGVYWLKDKNLIRK